MKKKITLFLIITISILTIYFGLIALLIITGSPQEPTSSYQKIDFKELFTNYSKIPRLKNYTARDKVILNYRHYPSSSNNIIILLHGSGWHSRYFFPLATFLSKNNHAEVYSPDLRGHGYNPQRRGDVNYIGQLEDDLSDFIDIIKKKNPEKKIILGGHSAGGGLAIRFAGSEYGKKINAYLLLAPYLKYNAPVNRPVTGYWAQPYISRIIGLVILNQMRITCFNYLPVLKFNMPETARNGTETLTYSYRLNVSFTPRNYKTDLLAIKRNTPLLLIAGSDDETFYADKYKPIIKKYTKNGKVKIIKETTHIGIVMNKKIFPVIQKWLKTCLDN